MITLLLLVVGVAAQSDVTQQQQQQQQGHEFPTALFQATQTSGQQLDPCQYLLKNITDVENMAQHEYATLEQCLYYYLAGESVKRLGHLGIPHPIASIPPNYLSRGPVDLTFHQITLQHFELNEFLRDLSIHGYMEVSWDDDRLMWPADTWKLDKLQIQSLNHLWIPVITAQNFDTALRNGDTMDMRRVITTNKGNVSALINFSLKTFCDDSDFANFPDDVYKCCYQLEPHLNQDIIEFKTDGLPVFTDPKYFRDYGWVMSGTIPTVLQDPNQLSQLGFCINLQRSASSVRIELTVPTLICSLIFLLTPFLGQIRLQIMTKLFILGLQFLAFHLFTLRIAPHLGSASATPKLLRFHEFSVVINALSIAASIFLWSCSRIKRDLPPWGVLTRASDIVNKFICVFHSVGVDEEVMEKAQSSNYQKDWTSAFVALHAVVATFFSLVLIFGYILLL